MAGLEVPLCPGQPVGKSEARQPQHAALPAPLRVSPAGTEGRAQHLAQSPEGAEWGEPADLAKPFFVREGAGGQRHALLGSACKGSRWGRGLPTPKLPPPPP